MTDNITRRIGKFYISPDLLRDERLVDSNKAVFGKIIPLHIERDYFKPKIEYIGISELFEELEPGTIIPLYDITVEKIYGPLDCIWYTVRADIVSYVPEGQETIFTE